MDRDEARRRLRELITAEDTTPLVFRHPVIEQPLPAGDLAAIIIRLRADLGIDFPEPIQTPARLARLKEITPTEAGAIADFLRVHFDGFERRRSQHLGAQPGREEPWAYVESHLASVERYRAAQRFFAAVAKSHCPAQLE